MIVVQARSVRDRYEIGTRLQSDDRGAGEIDTRSARDCNLMIVMQARPVRGVCQRTLGAARSEALATGSAISAVDATTLQRSQGQARPPFSPRTRWPTASVGITAVCLCVQMGFLRLPREWVLTAGPQLPKTRDPQRTHDDR